MKKCPLVSIIIPCYNHEMFLDDCIISILQQDYENIEILICDDCSTDSSYLKIKKYEEELRKRFKRVIILKNNINQGVTKNINRMLAKAEGDLIKILASDDLMVKTAISKFVDFLEKSAEIDVVVANGVRITEEQHYPHFDVGSRIYDSIPDFVSPDLFSRIYALNYIFAPGVMIRKNIYDRYGVYDERISIEDLEFWLRILKTGEVKIGYLNDTLIYYRTNANSITSQMSNAGLEKRRLRFHKAEIQILDKYGTLVSSKLYAETKIKRILVEKFFAINHNLKELEKNVDNEFYKFSLWQFIPLRKIIYYFLKFAEADIKKMFVVLKAIFKGRRGLE